MNLTSDVATTPGWYGKLPTLGDFASRRLEADFIEPWDLWLGERLQRQRQTLGDAAWLDAYLDTPPWRFLLSPGVLAGGDPARVFAGVLLPSVDRVGRHFPLTLAASLTRTPSAAAEFDALLAWLHRLEDTALDALQSDWSIDDLERALADLPPPADEAASSAEDRLATVRRAVAAAVVGRGGFVDIAGVTSRAELAAVFSSSPGATAQVPVAAPGPALYGIAFWIADLPGRPQLLVSEGLPGDDEFGRMFAGGGGSTRGAASRSAPEEDDPLATLPLPLGAPLVPAAPFGKPEETDLLGMFKGTAAPTSAEDAGLGLPPGDDILALFGAGDEAAQGEPGIEGAPKDNDILGLFAGQPEPPPTHESHAPGESDAAAAEREGRPPAPDILDLFGGPPAEPVPGKTP